MKLTLSKQLSLPMEAATETFAVLGRRGSGKTHTAGVFVEELLAAGVPACVIDPLDVWWGLLASKDGRSAGFPIYVFGGSHQHAPLTAASGRLLADVAVERSVPMILSLRHLSKTEQRRFVGEFCERLYERKGTPEHRTAMHVVIDEADAFVPQRIPPGGEPCFGAVDTMVRRGRSSGLATTLISQRPQVINKDALSQTEVLVCHQLTAPQDRKALEAWIEANDDEGRRGEFMAGLAALPRGSAWFWSPGLLKIFTRVDVRDRKTFDSSSTPRPGAATPKAVKFAQVDLDRLTTEIRETAARAEAEDPTKLRAKIRELERRLSAAPADAELVRDLRLQVEDARIRTEAWMQYAKDLEARLGAIERACQGRAAAPGMKAATDGGNRRPQDAAAVAPKVEPRRQPEPEARPSGNPGGSDLPKAQRGLLTAIAQRHPLRSTRVQVSIVSGYSIRSSSFANALGALRTAGYIAGVGDDIGLTPSGAQAIGPVDPMPRGHDLLSWWSGRLGRAERAMLEAIVGRPGITREQLSAATGYSITSSSFANALGKLRSLDLVSGRAELRPSDLFLG